MILTCQRVAAAWSLAFALPAMAGDAIDFNRDIRPILSENCFKCHGPDENKRKGGSSKTGRLRLDTEKGSRMDLGGYAAVVPGQPDESELIYLVTTEDEDDRMPPRKEGKRLNDSQIALLEKWIENGAEYAGHWAYQAPVRPPVPEIDGEGFRLHNPIDHFIARRLVSENLAQSPEAARYALARRVALDLTGLPPSLDDVETFVSDTGPDAYERFVEKMLNKPAYGEHWARKWLDLARYADSAGYSDDPERTIWGFRDYVIRSFNENKPFDQFTIEQIAGDLLDNPTTEHLVATAFHRNTQTNNEGGTSDEEFRNVAVVDRVNTTMAVWMGTTMNCAQCHTHKYDPISQEEYFRMFAIFNNTSDEDRRDEAPAVPIFTKAQERQRAEVEEKIVSLENSLFTKLDAPIHQERRYGWEERLKAGGGWHPLLPAADGMKADSGATFTTEPDGAILVGDNPTPRDAYRVTSEPPADIERVTGIRLEVLPLEHTGDSESAPDQNFVLNELEVTLLPSGNREIEGRFVRIELEGSEQSIQLAEVEVFSGDQNITGTATASQSSTVNNRTADLAIDGNTDGSFQARSTAQTEVSENPWWEVKLRSKKPLNRIVVWNHRAGDDPGGLNGFKLSVLDNDRNTVWEKTFPKASGPKVVARVSDSQRLTLSKVSATFEQDRYDAALAMDESIERFSGWAVDGRLGIRHEAVFELAEPAELPEGATLQFELHHNFPNRKLKRFRISVTGDADPMPAVPLNLAAAMDKRVEDRSDREEAALLEFFARFDPEPKPEQAAITELRKRLDSIKPLTTVPILREVTANRSRKTHIQHRGNFLDKGAEVTPGLPSAFHALPEGAEPARLGLAQWLVDGNNPLTARVVANRYWEALFGLGIVPTSEEFGSQGELPSDQELLDWLAVELVESGWDLKHLLRLLVTSATYRQSSKVSPELYARDPDNRLLARGPRFRISAEMVRDQALAVSGLLSDKMYGPSVNPPQPELGLKAAFGSKTDWTTSEGEDKHRRGIYTTWRRTNPYPSMAAFDAPNREFCTVRRDRTNTPLQALVTLNDPVYIEASQALGRRMAGFDGSIGEKAAHGFRLCLIRHPSDQEVAILTQLYRSARQRYACDETSAVKMATDPIGALPSGAEAVGYAAWTVVGNALLNLDEMFLKR